MKSPSPGAGGAGEGEPLSRKSPAPRNDPRDGSDSKALSRPPGRGNATDQGKPSESVREPLTAPGRVSPGSHESESRGGSERASLRGAGTEESRRGSGEPLSCSESLSGEGGGWESPGSERRAGERLSTLRERESLKTREAPRREPHSSESGRGVRRLAESHGERRGIPNPSESPES